MGKIRILFFHFDLGEGGAERVLVNLLNHLDSNRFDITLRTIFSGFVNNKNLGSHIKFKPLFNRRAFRGMRPLLRLIPAKWLNFMLIKEDFDIQIAYLEGIPTRIVGAKQRNSKTKKYAWIHTSADSPSSFTRSFQNYKEFKKIYENFDKLAFVSRQTLLDFEKYHHINLTKEVVHNVNDFTKIENLSNEEIEFKLNRNINNLCTVGRLTKLKRFDRLIEALSVIYQQGYSNWHLYILGKGELEQDLRNLVKNLGLTNKITFLGFQKNPYKYIKNMDLFVCSSEKEGFSTAVTESIYLGVPVVTTKCAGMEEIIENNKNGFIVENSTKGLIDGLKHYFDLPKVDKIKMKEKTIEFSGAMNISTGIQEFENFIS